jgi:Na+/proline symporter
MSTNVLFVILTSIIIILVLIYLVAIKKGKSQESFVVPSAEPKKPAETEEVEDEEL